MNNANCLSIESLTVKCQSASLVENITFSAKSGVITALVGPSGSGKTTIINSIGGLTARSLQLSGTIRIGGTVQSAATSVLGRSGVSVIFQGPLKSLNPVFSAGRYLYEIARAQGEKLPQKYRIDPVQSVFSKVGLTMDKAKLFPSELSGGERQKLLIAGALLAGPKVILADEPTASLDVVSKSEILKILSKISQRLSIPIIISTHDIRTIKNYATDAVVLSSGRIQQKIPSVKLSLPPYPTPANAALSTDDILIIENVNKYLGEKHVINDLSLSFGSGAKVGLAGRSGCGKTTLARCITGLINIDGGSISLRGLDGTWRKKITPGPNIQMIFQEPYASFDPRWSLAQSFADAIYVSGKENDHSACFKQAIEALSTVGLGNDIAMRKPGEVSGGECQRAAIARAIACSPSVLIADEPTSSLDYEAERKVLEQLRHSQELEGFALLIISHDIQQLTEFCSEIAVMSDGKIVEYGEAARIKEQPITSTTAELVNALKERPKEALSDNCRKDPIMHEKG